MNSLSENGTDFHRSDTVFYTTSPAYEAGNTTYLELFEGAVQIFMMGVGNRKNQWEKSNTGPSILCRIVSMKDGNPNKDKEGAASMKVVDHLSLTMVICIVLAIVLLQG